MKNIYLFSLIFIVPQNPTIEIILTVLSMFDNGNEIVFTWIISVDKQSRRPYTWLQLVLI
jgi:hypothetical protein